MKKITTIYCEGAFNTTNGKTAHGLVRFTERYEIQSVIDSNYEGLDAGKVLDNKKNGIPIVGSVNEAMAIDEKRELIYVLDYMRHTILAYSIKGTFLFEFGGRGFGPAWFNYPTDMAVNDQGHLIIADLFNKRAQVLAIEHEKIKDQLEELGHEAFISQFAQGYLGKSEQNKEQLAIHDKNENDAIRKFWEIIKKSDAILVLNYDRKGIKNYIGGNTLMEIGFAHVLEKKIFLMNPIPDIEYYCSEIEAVRPLIIEQNLKNIK